MEVVIPGIDALGVFPDFVLSPENAQELEKLQDIFDEIPGGVTHALGCAICAARDLGSASLTAETKVLKGKTLRVSMRCPKAPLYTQSPRYGAPTALSHLPCKEESGVNLIVS